MGKNYVKPASAGFMGGGFGGAIPQVSPAAALGGGMPRPVASIVGGFGGGQTAPVQVAPVQVAPRPTAAPPAAAPAAAPAASSSWSYGQALTPEMLSRPSEGLVKNVYANSYGPASQKTQTASDYGLGLAQTLQSKYGGDLQKMLSSNLYSPLTKRYNINSAQDLLYTNAGGRPGASLGGFSSGFGSTTPASNAALANYRLDHMYDPGQAPKMGGPPPKTYLPIPGSNDPTVNAAVAMPGLKPSDPTGAFAPKPVLPTQLPPGLSGGSQPGHTQFQSALQSLLAGRGGQ